jgi:hypothetical protein
MARYEIQGPDGGRYEVTAPDSMPEAQVLERFKAEVGASAPTPETWGEFLTGLARQGAQGLTFNTADEAEAWLRSLGGADYDQTVGQIRRENEQFTSQHPVASFAANVAGGAPLFAGPGGAVTGLARASQWAARGATLPRTMGRSALLGAGLGAAAGAGAGEGGVGERLASAATGAAVGAGIGGAVPPVAAAVAPVVARAANMVPQFLRRAAPEAAPRPGAVADDVRQPPAPAPAGEPPRAPAAQQTDLGIPEAAAPQAAAEAAAAPRAASWQLGQPTQVITPDGSMTVTAVPEIVELSSLRFARGDLQPRDRGGRVEYTLGARERATALDPERLMPARTSDIGAPVVTPDGTILSGNGRVMSINEVYSSPALAERAAAYRSRLGTTAQGMERPVLVMRLQPMGTDEAARFADLSNRPAVAAMSVTERAARDARALGDDALALYQGGDFDAPQNLPFLRAFMERAVTPAERASVSANNRLTQEGAQRMRAAVLASAYDDPVVIGRMLESIDDNLRNITNALVDAAPAMAQLRADIRTGLVPDALGASKALSEAIRVIGDLRNRGTTPARHYAQADAFSATSPIADDWVRALYNGDLTRPWSRERMAAILNAYADEARLHRTGGLFPDTTTDDQVLDAAVRRVAREWGEEAAPVAGAAAPGAAGRVPDGRTATGAPAPPPPGGPPGGGQSAADQASREAWDNAAAQSLGPRDRLAGRGDEPINRYLERVANEPRRISAEPTRHELAQAAEAEGVGIPRVVGSGTMMRRFAGGLRDTFVGAPLQRASNTAKEDIGARLQEVAGKYSDLSERSAGESARKGLAEWIETDGRGSQVVQGLFDRVRRLIKGREEALNPLPETRRIAGELEAQQVASASELNKPALDLVKEALGRQGGLSFQGLMGLRTQIGHLIDGTIMPAPGTPIPALKRLYGALSEDLRAAAHRQGGDRAVQAFDKAVDVSSMVAKRRETLASIVGLKGDEAPEVVIDRLVRLADRRGGKGDAAALLKARRVLGEDWNAVAGAAIRKLGQKGDTFNIQQFLTRYENLSPNGRQILFRSSGKDDLADSLDNLALLSRKIADLSRFGNPSGTGNVATVTTSVMTAFYNPLYALGGIGGGYLLARALAKPLTVKATSRWVNAYLNHATAPTRATLAGLTLNTQLLARSMAQDGLGSEDELNRQLEAATRGGANGNR